MTMPQLRRRLLGLCLVPVLVAALDGSVTLLGQPSGYWAGDYSQVNEGTPGFRAMLLQGPAVYIAGLAGWVLAFVGMILLLPTTMALAVCLVFTLGHAIGSYTWMINYPRGRELHIVEIVFAALGLAVGIRWGWQCEPRGDIPLGARLPVALRWAVTAALGVVVLWYIWPR